MDITTTGLNTYLLACAGQVHEWFALLPHKAPAQ